MGYLLAGVLLLFASLWLAKAFTHANPRWLAGWMRKAGGTALLALAVLLLLRGSAAIAVPVAIFALSLLGWRLPLPWEVGGEGEARQGTGQSSTVRTAMLEMRLDHDTGEMTGLVLKGPYAGQALTAMPFEAVLDLWRDCQVRDPQGALLLETFLERTAPGWRQAQGGEGSAGGGGSYGAPGGPMTMEEAYKVLGLEPGAGRSEIVNAHRNLMKRFHPDQGGSNYLASKINEAKDVLLAGGRRKA